MKSETILHSQGLWSLTPPTVMPVLPASINLVLDSKGMDYRTYFRLSLLLPLLAIGAFELGFLIYGEEFTNSLPLFMGSLWVEAKAGLRVGWVLYGVLGAFLAWGFGKWPLRKSLLTGTLAPIYYGVLVLVSLFIYANLVGDRTAEDAGLFLAVFAVTYGYMYVAVVLAGYYVLRELGAVRA